MTGSSDSAFLARTLRVAFAGNPWLVLSPSCGHKPHVVAEHYVTTDVASSRFILFPCGTNIDGL